MTTKVLNVFPLIGGGFLGVEYLKSKGYDIENMKQGFSLSGAKGNEKALLRNKDIDILYWDEKYKDIECDCVSCGSKTFHDKFEEKEFDVECKKIDACVKDHKEILTDAKIMTSIPPCNSMSMANCSNESRSGKYNPASQLMIRCVEFALKSDIELFIFENAPRLATSGGIELLKQIEQRLQNYPEYSMSIVKTNSVWHGMGQQRERTFVFLWKKEAAPIMKFDIIINGIETLLDDIGDDFTKYCNKPQNDYQSFLRGDSTSLKENHTVSYDDYYAKWKIIHSLFGKERPVGSLGNELKKIDDIDKWFDEKFYKAEWKGLDVTKEERLIRHAHMKVKKGMGYWGTEPNGTWREKLQINATNGIISKSMGFIVHPKHERVLSFREECRLMGIPDNFEIEKGERFKITQNVPSFTFAAMIEQFFKEKNDSKFRFTFQQINDKDPIIYVGNSIEELFKKKRKYSKLNYNEISKL